MKINFAERHPYYTIALIGCTLLVFVIAFLLDYGHALGYTTRELLHR